MRLSALLASLPAPLAPLRFVRSDEADDPVIRGLTYDSRKVAPGDLFVALRGASQDGHDYLARALDLGAAALLVEQAPESQPLGRPVVVVPDTRRALAPIAARFYGEPGSECRLIGVTGTNGKTSTTFLVESILSQADVRTGLIGTVEIRYAGERHRSTNTTPESLDLQRTLRSMRTHGIEAVVMEVSSHGLELGRVSGCRFQAAAFTNLTQDHLDFHGTMDAYLAAKLRLFEEHLLPGAAAVVNVDDPSGDRVVEVAQKAGARVLRCSRRGRRDAEIRWLHGSGSLAGSRAVIALPSGELQVELPLMGEFNLENMLVAAGIGTALGVSPAAIASGIARCPQVPGRVERVFTDAAEEPTVVVDYAHTPDAIEKLLAAVRPLAKARLITVFGCGGDRDRAKRPLMARAVAAVTDIAIATSDNPRSEDPLAILHDVEQGLTSLPKAEAATLARHTRAYAVVPDRREAIELAIRLARGDDTVVLAGKGHEDYQIVGRDKLPFDDRDEARRALRARAEGNKP